MKDKDIRISFKAWALLSAKSTELKIKTGKRITLKSVIDDLVFRYIGKAKEEMVKSPLFF